MNITTYGTYIKERRKEINLTQLDLANRLHLTSQSISFYENDKVSIPLNLIGDFASILQVDLTSFLNLKFEKNNDFADLNKFNATKFAEYLSYLRKEKKITLNTLSKYVDLSVKKLSYFETEKSIPNIEEFITLATFYNISYEELYFCIEKPQKEETQVIEVKENVSPSNKKTLIIITATLTILFLLATALGIGLATYYINKEDEDDTEAIPPGIGDIEITTRNDDYLTF